MKQVQSEACLLIFKILALGGPTKGALFLVSFSKGRVWDV